METILQHAQGLVCSLLCLMPSIYQNDSLKAIFALFLAPDGHALPAHTQIKSASSLSRFLNHYSWPTRQVIRISRRAVVAQLAQHRPHPNAPLKLLLDLTTLPKIGKFQHLSTVTDETTSPDPWVRMLNQKRGLHLVMLYLVLGQWRVPWGFRIWRGKGHPSPVQLAGQLLATLPKSVTQGRSVIVQADTEFGTIDFLAAVRARRWHAVVGVRHNRTLQDGRHLKDLYRHRKRGCQVYLKGLAYPLTVSWFWLKRAEGKRELRFVASTYPYSGTYLVRLGRQRWAIEGFFKTVKHRFGLHCFGQSTPLGVYRWLILSCLAYLLTHWIHRWHSPSVLDWRKTARLAMETLLPDRLWLQVLRQIRIHREIAALQGFQIVLAPLPEPAYQECYKI